MRRLIALLAAGLLCLVVAAPAAAKGPPEISPIPPSGVPAEALVGTCDFAAEIVDTSSTSRERVFPASADGDQIVRYSGGFRSTITNLDSGESLEIKYFGGARYLYNADGTVDIRAGGTVLLWIYPEDVLSIFEPGIYLVTGNLHVVVDGATFLSVQPEEFTGRVVDLCDALS